MFNIWHLKFINKILFECQRQTGKEDKRKGWIKLGIAYYEENLF